MNNDIIIKTFHHVEKQPGLINRTVEDLYTFCNFVKGEKANALRIIYKFPTEKLFVNRKYKTLGLKGIFGRLGGLFFFCYWLSLN